MRGKVRLQTPSNINLQVMADTDTHNHNTDRHAHLWQGKQKKIKLGEDGSLGRTHPLQNQTQNESVPKMSQMSAANTPLTGQYKAKSNSMTMAASLGKTHRLQNQTQNESVHVILTALNYANMHGADTKKLTGCSVD